MLPRLPETLAVTHAGLWNWNVAPGPNAGWATMLFPELEPAAALDKLWDQIAYVLRLDTPDPVAAWTARMDELGTRARALTAMGLDALHFEGPGTDLTVGLLPSSVWEGGGGDTTAGGISFNPNIPTEETFTAPDPLRVDGHVASTRPLVVGGGVVEGLAVRFEGGRAVSVEADRGAELVATMIAKDEGASRLGEVALVDREGRVGQTGTVFYETLLDENSASHIALGAAYPDNVSDPADSERINESQIHIDFMIGANDVSVTGLNRDGSQVPLLRDGNWQFSI
jgi:aminopeptidase